jgi:hypothetical protein
VEAFENLVGDIIGRLELSAEHSIQQDQLAPRAVDFPAGGFIDGAVFVTVTAPDALVEGASPFF